MQALNDGQLSRLVGTIGTLVGRGVDLGPLTPFRLGVVGTGTLDLLLPQLVAGAARHGAPPLVAPRYWRTAAFTAMVLIVAVYRVVIQGRSPDIVYMNF